MAFHVGVHDFDAGDKMRRDCPINTTDKRYLAFPLVNTSALTAENINLYICHPPENTPVCVMDDMLVSLKPKSTPNPGGSDVKNTTPWGNERNGNFCPKI